MNPNAADAVVVIAPADLAVAQTGTFVSLKGAQGVTFTFNKGAGTAGQPPVLTFRQAKTTGGSSAKDLANITTVYKKNAGSNTWTKVTQAAGATYTGDVAAGLYKVDISATQLDNANDFTAVSVNIASSGAAAQLGGIVGELYGMRYGGTLDGAIAPFGAEAAAEDESSDTKAAEAAETEGGGDAKASARVDEPTHAGSSTHRRR